MSKRLDSKNSENSNELYTLLPDVGLLEEFAEYGNNFKAKRVYRKCVVNQKFELAEKIKLKYRLEDRHDDRITAFGLAMMAQANCR
jgi:hypothetical protein